MNKMDAHKIATMKVMTKYTIPFIKGRQTCIECMMHTGVTEADAISIVDEVCKEINEMVEWTDKQSKDDIALAKGTERGKKELIVKAMRELRGIGEEEMSDEEARKMVDEVEKEAKRLGLI